jgi:hypothetical protein
MFLAYVFLQRPLEDLWEQRFAVASAVAQLAMAVLGTMTTVSRSKASVPAAASPVSKYQDAFDVCTMLSSGLFFAQAVVLAARSLWSTGRGVENDAAEREPTGKQHLLLPLLATVPTTSASTITSPARAFFAHA